MRKVLVIALRDYNAAVRTKAFLVSLFLLPVLMGGSFVVQYLLRNQRDTKAQHYAVVDRTGGSLHDALAAAAEKRNAQADAQGQAKFLVERVEPSPWEPDAVARQRLELSERVRRRELRGFVDIGPEAIALPGAAADPERAAVRYQSESPLGRDFPSWAGAVLNGAVQDARAVTKGLSPGDVRLVQTQVPLSSRGLSKSDPATGGVRDGEEVNIIASFLVPFMLVMLMFMMIFVGATPLIQGVVEEKTQRIAEVLLGSVRPFQLMLGKLLGTVGVASTLSAVYLGCGFAAAAHYGYGDILTPGVVAWFLVYEVLGVLLFGSLFIAVGSACTNMQESQTLIMPVTLLAVLPMFVLERVVREPDSTLSTAASFFPTATPMLMTVRIAVPPGAPGWQPVVGVVGVLLTTLVCVWVAGRIFRVGLLMQGKAPTFGQLVQWVLRG